MTPADIKDARATLGLSQSGLAEALRMGKNGGRTVRRWELGEIPITGPAAVALALMVAAALERLTEQSDETMVERAIERIRTLVWNREKAEGNTDQGAMKAVEEEIAALRREPDPE